MTIIVGPVHYDSAAAALTGGASRAATLYNQLVGQLGDFGAMAGDDATSIEFAAEYDRAARDAVDCLNVVVDAFATLAGLTDQSVENHRRADQGSVYLRPPPVYHGTTFPTCGPADVRAFTPPSSLGGENLDIPDFWDQIVDHLQGFAWPNADTGRLRNAGSAWRTAGTGVSGLTWYCDQAGSEMSDQSSPEVPLARAAYRELGSMIEELATELRGSRDQNMAHTHIARRPDGTYPIPKGWNP